MRMILATGFAALALAGTALADDPVAPATEGVEAANASAAEAERPALHEATRPLVVESAAVHAALDGHEDVMTEEEEQSAPGYGDEADEVFNRFARPVTNLNFNHPFIWSEFRPVYLQQRFPEGSALGGGKVGVYAAQLWVKLTDRIQLVADKDGWVDLDTDDLGDERGFVDIGFGLKGSIYQDPDRQEAAAIGILYETTNGDGRVFQGDGHGMFDFFLATAKGWDELHALATVGVEMPTKHRQETRALHFHGHLDYEVTEGFWPLLEVNGYHYLSDAKRDADLGTPLNFEGYDLTSFGSSDVDNDTVMTGAIGFRYALSEDVTVAFAYEVPIKKREHLIDHRFTFDFTFRF